MRGEDIIGGGISTLTPCPERGYLTAAPLLWAFRARDPRIHTTHFGVVLGTGKL
jgi:hypothetical protein